MSKILILGDIHLGKSKNLGKSTISSNFNSRLADQKNILDWILVKCYDENVTDIYLTGDIFEEPNPSYEIINIFLDWIMSCKIHDIKVYIILGNHDYKRIGNTYYSPLDILKTLDFDHVKVYYDNSTILYDCGVGISVFPFKDRKSLFEDSMESSKEYIEKIIAYESASIPIKYTSIAIGHFALEGSLYVGDEIDDISNEIILPLNYFKSYDYTWMGHVHKYQILNKKPYISHIGSMDISDFGESDESKHIIIFDLNTKEFKSEIIPTRKLEKIKIVIDNNSVEEELNKLDIRNKIVSIEIEYKNDSKSIGKSKIKEILLKKNPHNISSVSESKEVKLKENSKSKDFKIDIGIESALETYSKNFIPENLQKEFLSKAKDLIKEIK